MQPVLKQPTRGSLLLKRPTTSVVSLKDDSQRQLKIEMQASEVNEMFSKLLTNVRISDNFKVMASDGSQSNIAPLDESKCTSDDRILLDF